MQSSEMRRRLVGGPLLDAERVGHDACPGRERRELVPQLQQVVGQEEQRQDGGLLELRGVHVALDEGRLVADTRLRRVLLRELDHVRVVLDAQGPRAALRCGNHVTSIAGTEVDHEVPRRDFGHVEHFFYSRLRARHPDDVLPRLSNPGLVLTLQGCGLASGRGRGRLRTGDRRNRRQPQHETRIHEYARCFHVKDSQNDSATPLPL